jgi:membrane associated rhomboid family serine protease
MKPAARTYWVAVAHERLGETAAAEAAYAKARSRTRGRPRVLIDQALERLKHAKPAELGPTATEVVARVEAEPVPVVTERLRPRGPIATRILVLACLAVATVVGLVLGESTDVGMLMRSGALVHGLVHDGEWWRLVTFSFVHVGGIHLIVNVIGLWFLGRLVEEMFGPWRTVAIFAVAGISAAVASFLASPAGISAGASGALFGLLGAAFIELSLHRKRHRTAWSRAVWGSLAVLTVAQIGSGFVYPVIDQWAHGAGLVGGTLAAIALSPNARWTKLAEYVARAIAIGFALVAIGSGVLAARTSIADSFAHSPRALHALGTVQVIAPASWSPGMTSDQLVDADLWIMLVAQRVEAIAPLEEQLAANAEAEPKRAKDFHFDQIEAAPSPLIPLPPTWQGSELVVSFTDTLGSRQRYRVLVAARPDAAGIVQVSLYAPETVAKAAPGFFTELLASVQ